MLIDFPVQFSRWVWKLMGVITAESLLLGGSCQHVFFFISANLLLLLIKKR